jgi:hypothetical protein
MLDLRFSESDPYRPFALTHRCDAAWAACSYPDHLLEQRIAGWELRDVLQEVADFMLV